VTDHPISTDRKDIVDWLIGPARQAATPEAMVAGLGEWLVGAGVPVARIRTGQAVANPLMSAWGIIWNRDGGSTYYTVPREMLDTTSYKGSPFEQVIETRQPLRKSLENLVPGVDHPVYFELAESGGTDYFALPISYGDGSFQVNAYTADRPGGFTDLDIQLIADLAPALAAALEPWAMRHSMDSLLEVYLGRGPAEKIAKGAFLRGATTEIDAAILITDLRDSTGMSERLAPGPLLENLGAYFEIVVQAVQAQGGDVLKFVGDGVLSVFPADESGREDACRRAAGAVAQAFGNPAAAGMRFVAALHVGPVVYGNIGSPNRLDFTVVGPTVNYVSRLEGIAKALDRKAVCSKDAAIALNGSTTSLGLQALKGIAEPQEVFELTL